ncbi:unnamed protein product [Phytomonas sp. EM1]|nr:unnamed protein product [Phytomonas sp. EM1]|eukprot:CCW60635.1 unnamed protein product [Phytomonas sp. isolate EM1]
MHRAPLFPTVSTGDLMECISNEASTRVSSDECDYFKRGCNNALNIRLCFIPPSLLSADDIAPRCGEDGTSDNDGAFREVLIPIKPVELVSTSVSGLINKFMRCLCKRYGSRVRQSGLTVRALWICCIAPRSTSPKAFDGVTAWQRGFRSSPLHSHLAGLVNHRKMIRIDALMNGDNTLDSFFPIPRRHPAYARRSPVVCVYDAFIEWEEALLPEEREEFRGGEPLISSRGGDLPYIKAEDKHQPLCAAHLEGEVCPPPPGLTVPLEAVLDPIPLNPVRSVYTDSGPLLTPYPTADSVGRMEGSEEKGDRGVPACANSDSMHLNSENLWELLSSSPKESMRDVKAFSRHRDAWQKLWEEETSVRNNLLYQESSAYRLIRDLASDSMWSIVSLSSLRGEFIHDDRLVALLRHCRRYPSDTLPLANRTNSADMQRLHAEAERTTKMAFLFASSSISKPKPSMTSEVENEKAERVDDPRIFHYRQLCGAIRRKGAAGVTVQRGRSTPFEAPPIRTCFPQKKLFMERSPDSVCMEDLPEGVYEETLASYTAVRHDIISTERRAYRNLMQMIREVLRKQVQLDELALKRAYAEEMAASDAFDINHYVSFYDDS